MAETAVRVRPLVFDLDGTLIDSRGDIAAACNFALRSAGRPPLSVAEIGAFVGNGSTSLLENTAGIDRADAGFEALIGHFGQYYVAHPTVFSTLLPGALEALKLPGRARALCTNKPRAVTERVLEGLSLGRYFAVVVAAGDCESLKPHPGPLELVAARLGTAACELVMIGDGPQDIWAGKAVGAHTIGVRGGFLPEADLRAARPDAILDTLLELPAYLDEQGL